MNFPSVIDGTTRGVNVGGGIVSARNVPLGVPGSSSQVVIYFCVPCSFVLRMHSPSVVDGNKRRVNVGGGFVSARGLLLGAPGFVPRVVLHRWAPCS